MNSKPSPHRLRSWSVLLATILLASGFAFWLNQGYGEVSPKGYEVANALLSACNVKNSSRIEHLDLLVQDLKAAGQIQPTEARWLQSIILQAQAGEWRSAQHSARRLMEDQREENMLPELD